MCPRSHSWLLSRRASLQAATPSQASNLPLTLPLPPNESCLLAGVWLLAPGWRLMQKGGLAVCMQIIAAKGDGNIGGVGVRWTQILTSPLAALQPRMIFNMFFLL